MPYSCTENFSVLKTNKDILNYSCKFFLNNESKSTIEKNELVQGNNNKQPGCEENSKQVNNIFFDNTDLKFFNVEKECKNIIDSLKKLNKASGTNKSGIYLFWLLENPYKCYLGSALDLKRRFKVHFKEALITYKHPKFYASVKKHGWSKFGFQIVNFHDKAVLLEHEQLWLNKIFNSEIYAENTLNILKSAYS